ncbi:MAG TPA: DnaJ C-terminal domain-containing protein [Stellaceae bacterium]|nr:DnaJ C-terminal domain-containing protein [Stellaceae bacterium]
MRDPYAVLGLARDASDDDVKRAFRRLAKRLHPDVNPGNRAVETQFRELNAAYEILSDPAKRRRFDRGEIDAEGRERGFGFGGGARARAGRGAGFSDFSLDEVFQEFLRRGRRSAGGRGSGAKAELANQALRISFLEAALGAKRQVALADGRTIEVAIPPGIDSGQKLRLHDGLAGDIHLDVTVDPHPLFTRKDRDIQVELPVSLADAVLGATLTVATIHGDVAVKVPKGSNSGALLRLKGKGIAAAGGAGDQYVRLRVMLPDPADPELTSFLERWAERRRQKVRGGTG